MLDSFTFLPFHRECTLDANLLEAEVGKRVRDLQTRTCQPLDLKPRVSFGDLLASFGGPDGFVVCVARSG